MMLSSSLNCATPPSNGKRMAKPKGFCGATGPPIPLANGVTDVEKTEMRIRRLA